MKDREYLIAFRGDTFEHLVTADSEEEALEEFLKGRIIIRKPEEIHRIYQCVQCEKECTVNTCGWPESCLHSYPDKAKWELREGWRM